MLIFLSIDFVLFILYGFYSITRTETYMYTHLAVYCTLICACACVCVSIETESGHPGHIFSGSSGSDPVCKLSGPDLDWIT